MRRRLLAFYKIAKWRDNVPLIIIAAYLYQTMSPKYRYKFRCFGNACIRLIRTIQPNVFYLYRETPTECLATSVPCSPSNEECHLLLRRDNKFSYLRRIQQQRNQLYPSFNASTNDSQQAAPARSKRFHTNRGGKGRVKCGFYFNRHVTRADEWIHSK